MKVCHTPAAVSAAFDDANLIARAGLVPVMRLAERCGLSRLIAGKVKLTGAKNGAGAAADAKVTSIVGGMVVGADSIDGLDVLRHGAMPTVFGGIRAPSTLGTFLRALAGRRPRRSQCPVQPVLDAGRGRRSGGYRDPRPAGRRPRRGPRPSGKPFQNDPHEAVA
ncbi:hypothetical protein AB0A94_37430 [Streptomyces sp. NPDC044984]|uniref:hypothetical protein n=1 Tax=Streptomyces sp. NPDC044984 TaxID=3154335 RepID=UPI0033DA25D5